MPTPLSTRQRATVVVPASTSNCGSGFDTLGLGLDLCNRISLSRIEGPGIRPETADDERAREMVATAAKLFFEHTQRAPFGFAYHIAGDVPPSRGFGSSVTVRAGVVAGLDALAGTGLSRHGITALVTELEGHPDNAAGSVLGGFCVARMDPVSGAYRGSVRVDVPDDLVLVAASPLVEIGTEESRASLPKEVPFFDAVRSVNSATCFVAAMLAGEFEKLRDVVSDFLHEPHRLPRIPGASAAIVAGVKAGAYTGWLSGSGSSVVCIATESAASEVEQAMARSFAGEKLACETRRLRADNTGLRVLSPSE